MERRSQRPRRRVEPPDYRPGKGQTEFVFLPGDSILPQQSKQPAIKNYQPNQDFVFCR